MRLSVACVLLALGCCVGQAQAEEKWSHGRFKDATIYMPQGDVKEVVLFLSGDGGWNLGVVDMAQALVAEGAMVVGVNTPQFIQALEADTAECTYADGDLEALSHFAQARAHLPVYHPPLLVGYSSGATLVYAMLAQAPAGTFSGGLALGFCPDLDMKKPICKGEDATFTRRPDGHTIDFLPTKKLRVPFVAMQGAIDQVCSAPATQAFVAQVPNAEVVMLPKVGHGYGVQKNWMPQFLASYRRLAQKQAAAVMAPPADLPDLPLVEVPAQGTGAGDTFAVLLSGDGGWAGLDKDVAATLSARGIPVAGIDTLRYFWNARTPDGLAADLDRVLRYYAAHWKKSRAILVGYSQGADVLPFAINRLPPASRALVVRAVLMGLGEKASFEFHFGNWVNEDTGGLPIMPEASKLDGAQTVCVYGQDERNSLCPRVPPGHVQARALPGGHHFDGAYNELADIILERPGAH